MLDKSVPVFFININSEPNAYYGSYRECIHVENLFYPPDISFCALHVLDSVCWPHVGPQDIKKKKEVK